MEEVKIRKYSEIVNNITLTNKQRKLVSDLIKEMAQLDSELKNKIKINRNVFLLPLLYLEGESTSLIEGTRSMFEDFAYDIEELNNIPQWETRNLITVYEKYLLDQHNIRNLDISVGYLQSIHVDLFRHDKKSKFKMVFDPSRRIEGVKPGQILSENKNRNFIGKTSDIKDASLLLLKPSDKKKYLEDLTNKLQNQIDEEELLIDHIIIQHPIFEAIHPFRDGNGRIGRLLISLLFAKYDLELNIPLFISEYFNETKKKYKELLFKVQTKDDYDSWNNWISYFIDGLIKTKRKLEIRIRNISALLENAKKTKVFNTPIREEIATSFFKYYKLNRSYIIRDLIVKHKNVSIQTIYKDFKIVTTELNIKDIDNDYYVFEDLLKAIRI